MPNISVKTPEGVCLIEYSPGQTLREALDSTAFRVRSGCRGTGACGLCRVRVEGGKVDEPGQVERLYLTDEQLASGVRLACRLKAGAGMEITVLSRESASAWRAIPAATLRRSSAARPAGTGPLDLPIDIENPCGMAVDLGTTHISLSFLDLRTGKRLAGRQGPNPQIAYGTDVLARLMAANESAGVAEQMRERVVDSIGSAIRDVAASEGIPAGRVARVVLVGNTAMLALLSGRNYHLLLQPANWTRMIDCTPDAPGEMARGWGIHPEARVEVMGPLAGFVGSDLLAGCIALNLAEGKPGGLFIDFGTNSEIALWDGKKLWVTSAAGGPAFEGCGIGCGMPAEPGAVYRVCAVDGNSNARGGCRGMVRSAASGLDLRFTAIDHGEPVGLCGSGIVDLIAILVRSGKLLDTGRFAPGTPAEGLVFLDGNRQLVLTVRDIDIFQRAKAAIGAGVRVLMSAAGMTPSDLRAVYVGGAFGYYLDRANAAGLGLIPGVEPGAVHLCGNTALGGCEDLLMSADPAELVSSVRGRTELINLAQVSEFEDFFLEGLYLSGWPRGD